MSALFRLTNRAWIERGLINQALRLSRQINTSPKKNDTAALTTPNVVTKEDFANPNPKNWVSWGFDFKSETNDRNVTHATFFVAITLCIVWGGFVWSYLPDKHLLDWSQRQAYLELRRREEAGLEPVSANYVDPAKINLPIDEELGDTEIII